MLIDLRKKHFSYLFKLQFHLFGGAVITCELVYVPFTCRIFFRLYLIFKNGLLNIKMLCTSSNVSKSPFPHMFQKSWLSSEWLESRFSFLAESILKCYHGEKSSHKTGLEMLWKGAWNHIWPCNFMPTESQPHPTQGLNKFFPTTSQVKNTCDSFSCFPFSL